MTSILAPKSTNTFEMMILSMVTMTKGLLSYPYFGTIIFPNISLASYLITCIILGSYFFLPNFLVHISFTDFS